MYALYGTRFNAFVKVSNSGHKRTKHGSVFKKYSVGGMASSLPFPHSHSRRQSTHSLTHSLSSLLIVGVFFSSGGHTVSSRSFVVGQTATTATNVFDVHSFNQGLKSKSTTTNNDGGAAAAGGGGDNK